MKDANWVRQVFTNLDAMDNECFLSFLTDGARFRFGNAEIVTGKDAIHTAVEDFFRCIKRIRHKLLGTWIHPDTVICQGKVTYTRMNNSQVTVPFVNIWQMKNTLIREYLIYVDISPLWSISS